MITAVDTNVLLDIVAGPAPHTREAVAALGRAAGEGNIVVSDVVYAELAARFPTSDELEEFLTGTKIVRVPSGSLALHLAGRAWVDYVTRRPNFLQCPSCGARNYVKCEQCGEQVAPRQHMVADFLIGAHAMVHADRLLTRDHGYYRTYFPNLKVE